MSSGRVTTSYVEASTNSPGCRMNGSSPRRLDQAGEVGLLLRRVDVRVAVVLEDPEVAVDAHVDARRLDHLGIVRLERDPPGRDLLANVPV